MRIRLADITGFSRLAFASLKTKLYQSKKEDISENGAEKEMAENVYS